MNCFPAISLEGKSSPLALLVIWDKIGNVNIDLARAHGIGISSAADHETLAIFSVETKRIFRVFNEWKWLLLSFLFQCRCLTIYELQLSRPVVWSQSLSVHNTIFRWQMPGRRNGCRRRSPRLKTKLLTLDWAFTVTDGGGITLRKLSMCTMASSYVCGGSSLHYPDTPFLAQTTPKRRKNRRAQWAILVNKLNSL